MEAELDQVDGRPIIGPELHLECPIGEDLVFGVMSLVMSWGLRMHIGAVPPK